MGKIKKWLIACAMLTLLSVNIFPQSMTLDEAIKITASELGQRISGSKMPINFSLTEHKIAVLNFTSDWVKLSGYVIDELNNAIVRNGSLTVVDRQQLDLVRQEQKFQISGDVDDKSAQNIGKFLGAQSVLSGSFTVIGNTTYRFRIRVIAVETGVLLYSNSLDIKKDALLTALMPASPKSPKTKETWKPRNPIFDDYTIYNSLAIVGYVYSHGLPLGFSFGLYGIYTSLGFALPDFGKYKKLTEYSSEYDLTSYSAQRYEIINWALGYNITIIPNKLYLPVGVGIESVREYRLIGSSNPEWYPAPKWETNLLFEVGLLFRPRNDYISPYLFGSYKYVLPEKQNFSIGGGISFEKG